MERIPVTTAVGSLEFAMIDDRDSLDRRNQRLRSASASGWMANPKFKICCTIVVEIGILHLWRVDARPYDSASIDELWRSTTTRLQRQRVRYVCIDRDPQCAR